MDERLKAGNRCPVVHDFDQESPEHAANWPEAYKKMRNECPRAWSENHGGHWVATRYEDVLKIAQTADVFTSGKKIDPETGEITGGLCIPANSAMPIIPDETDNPEWYGYRSMLNRHFAPKAAEAHRTFAKGLARTLINRVIETGKLDIVRDFANPLPAIFTMNLLGLDLDRWTEFAGPVHQFAYVPMSDPDYPNVVANLGRITELLLSAALERRGNPRDDLLSVIANDEIDGQKLTEEEISAMTIQITMGGIDTTTALTSNVLRYLSQHPDQRQELIDNPSLMPIAREEFVRFFTPVHSLGRTASRDYDLDGWKFKEGERVLISFASANRDDEIFEDAGNIHLNRFPNRHIGFGAGMHRCIGSFFARVMFESMMVEVLERMPDYHVLEGQVKSYLSVAKSNGWITMPAIFTPGPQLDGGFPL